MGENAQEHTLALKQNTVGAAVLASQCASVCRHYCFSVCARTRVFAVYSREHYKRTIAVQPELCTHLQHTRTHSV